MRVCRRTKHDPWPEQSHATAAEFPATTPAHRRVVHLELAADPLPGGLTWYHHVQEFFPPRNVRPPRP
jgi:hypothetical protein